MQLHLTYFSFYRFSNNCFYKSLCIFKYNHLIYFAFMFLKLDSCNKNEQYIYICKYINRLKLQLYQHGHYILLKYRSTYL